MSLRIYTLGAFSVQRGEPPIPDSEWKTQKNKTLIKILLTHCGHPLSKDQLIEWIWPELAVEAASRDLRVAVSRSRQVLEPSLSRSSQSTFLLTTPAGYMWNTQAVCWLDAAEFEALCSELDGDLQPENLEHQWAIAERAKALYRGEYLEEDRYADWATAKREELREMYFTLLTRMAEIQARQGRYRRSIALCREVLAADACRESVYRQLMLYYYLSGNSSEAVRTYEQCVQALKDELDVKPVSQTRQLYEQIRTQQVPEIDKLYPSPSVIRPQIPYTLSPGSVPFVGRQAEYAQLVGQLEQAREGRGSCTLIGGEAGVGKTRLVQEFLTKAQRQFKARIFQGRAQELGFQRSYQPWADIVRAAFEQVKREDLKTIPMLWLAEVAKLAPELRTRIPSLPENPSLSPKQEQLRFFESLTQFLQSLVESKHAPKPLVLLLDDLHWVDSSSLDFLNYFLPRIEDKPILILGTYRSEEINQEHPLSKLIQTWEPKTLLHHISLSRLAAQEVSELLKKLPLTVEQPNLLGGLLYKETAGNPLFLVSTLQHFFEEGTLRVEGSSWIADLEDLSARNRERMIPPTIRELITQRIARLGELDEKFLRLASVAGRKVELSLLEKAWEGTAEECWSALTQLTETQWFSERQGRYEFSHDKIREVIYEEMSPARRQLLHQRVMRALEQSYASRLEEWAGLLAQHAFRAREWQKALAYVLQALKQAVQAYRQREGLELIEIGLAAIRELGAVGMDAQCFELLVQRAEIYDLQGEREKQERDLVKLQELAERSGDTSKLSLVLRKKCHLFRSLGQYPEAEAAALRALDNCRAAGDRTGESECLIELGRIHANCGRFEEALHYSQQAWEVSQEIGNRRNQATSMNNIGVIYFFSGQYQKALPSYQQALAIYEKIGDRRGQQMTLGNIGDIHCTMGNYREALRSCQQALEIAREIGSRESQGNFLINLGDIRCGLGNHEAALQYFQQALHIFEEIGERLGQGLSLRGVGDVSFERKNYAEALRHYTRARVIFEEIGAKDEQMPCLSREATAHLQLNEKDQALARSVQAMQMLEGGQSCVNPQEVIFNHFKILSVHDRTDEALNYLQKAHEELMQHADRIKDESVRESFLRDVKVNREIEVTWQNIA